MSHIPLKRSVAKLTEDLWRKVSLNRPSTKPRPGAVNNTRQFITVDLEVKSNRKSKRGKASY
jgi:hypothetical protein